MKKPPTLIVSVLAVFSLFTLAYAASQTCSASTSSGKTDSMGAKELVASTIDQNKVVIFSKSYCPFCAKAKRALGSVLDSSKITVLELDQRDDGAAIQDELASLTGGRSVPRVFINQKFIGGGDDTERLAGNGELAKMVKDV